MRLDLLANRALFQSQMSQRLGEISMGPSYDGDDAATVVSLGSSELPPRRGPLFSSVPKMIIEEEEEEDRSIVIKIKPSAETPKSQEQIKDHMNVSSSCDSQENEANSPPTHRSIPSSYFRNPSPQYLLQRPSRIITEENESVPVEQLDDEDFNDENFDSSITSESPLISSGRRMGWEESSTNATITSNQQVSNPKPTVPAKDTSYLPVPAFSKRALPPIIRKSTM